MLSVYKCTFRKLLPLTWRQQWDICRGSVYHANGYFFLPFPGTCTHVFLGNFFQKCAAGSKGEGTVQAFRESNTADYLYKKKKIVRVKIWKCVALCTCPLFITRGNGETAVKHSCHIILNSD